MKLFISWSGNRSHKVAMIFRDWFPYVIQSIEPYMSSEDIDKGARWSTDIAKELENSTFGILCVTKENMNAPWLCFEAGALSKAMNNSYVSPFLFDIKHSEINGPILQFQSTVFQKEDIKKLLITVNKACGEKQIPEPRLSNAFDVWYPTLESALNNLGNIQIESEQGTQPIEHKIQGSDILEEILDLSRNNQKLLRNSDPKLYEKIETIERHLLKLIETKQGNNDTKLAVDIAGVIKNINLEELHILQKQIESLLTDIGFWSDYNDFGDWSSAQRIFFDKMFSNEISQKWLDSLDSIVEQFKLSSHISAENLFSEFNLYRFNKKYKNIAYKTIFELNLIYNSLKENDRRSLAITVAQHLNRYYESPKPTVSLIAPTFNPLPDTVDDLPF